jgi:hypothetical protein
MINVKNQFQDNSLEIEFSGESIETKTISVPISNDVNFKPIVDYLIGIIPNKTKLNSSFENFEGEENVEKLRLIKETIEEIYKEFNLSIDNMLSEESEQEHNEQENTEKDEVDPEDDLPF